MCHRIRHEFADRWRDVSEAAGSSSESDARLFEPYQGGFVEIAIGCRFRLTSPIRRIQWPSCEPHIDEEWQFREVRFLTRSDVPWSPRANCDGPARLFTAYDH